MQIYAYKNQERDSVTIKIDMSLRAVTVTNNDLNPFKTLKGENKKVKNPSNFCPDYFPITPTITKKLLFAILNKLSIMM